MRILVTNDDGIHAPGLKVCEEIARALSDDVWVVAPENDQSGVSHSLSLNDPLRLREVGERAFRREGHADRLRHHGRAPHHAGQAARPRAVRRQPRPERRRGRDLFGHGRRRDGGHDARRSVVRAVAGAIGLETRQNPHWDTAIEHAPDVIRRVLKAGHPARRAGQHQFPGLRAGRGEGHRGHDAGQARPGSAAHRRRATTGAAIRITGSPLRASERPTPRDGTDLSALGEQPHLGHAAAARSDRRAVHDAACRGFK